MLSIFKSKAPAMVGLDISSVSVKLLELSHVGDRYRVESYAVAPLPAEAVVEKNIKDVHAVSEAVQEAVKRAKTSLSHASVAVADSSVITKVLQMESSFNLDEVEGQIAVEADKYIPYPLEEVSLDFEILGPSAKNPEINDVLLVASRTENVESRVQAVAEGGLDVHVVDVESYAMERACHFITEQLPERGNNQTIAIIDIGAAVTNLTVLYNLTTIFTREEMFGGEQLTKEIQRHYGLTFDEAGIAKKQGNLPDDYVTEVLTPFKETAVLQVRRALQFFFSASQHSKISHILLAGGTSTIAGLDKMIEEQIGIPTSIANPFSEMIIAKKVDAAVLAKDAAALMICCGLALRSFD